MASDSPARDENFNSHERSRFTGKAKIEGHKVNTVRSTQWSTRLWNEWSIEKNASLDPLSPKIPDIDNLGSLKKVELDKVLSMFVEEITRNDGTDYPAETLNGVMYGIQRYLRQFDPRLNIFEKVTDTYKLFQKTYDEKMKRLSENRVGLQHKRVTQGVTEEHEELLWNNKNFNCYSAKGLSDTVFFYTSKVFGVIDGRAHRSLNVSNFKFDSENGSEYVELRPEYAKNYLCRNHGIETPSRALRQYHDPNNPRCYYNMLKYYINLIVKQTGDADSVLFLQPSESSGLNEVVFRNHAIGENTLQAKIGKLMKRAKIEGYFTNQSMMTSIATRLFGRGYSVRQSRGQYYNVDVHKAICKYLDPPLGPMEVSYSVETQAVLKLVQPEKLSVSQSTLVYNQQPLLTIAPRPAASSSLSLVPRYQTVTNPAAASTLFLQVQPVNPPVSMVNQASPASIVSNPTNLQESLAHLLNMNKQAVQANKGQPAQPNVSSSAIIICKPNATSVNSDTSTVTDNIQDDDGSLVQDGLPASVKLEESNEQQNDHSNNLFPLFLTEANNNNNTDATDGSPGSMLNDIHDVNRIIVKEEPADVDDEYGTNVVAMETDRTLDQILNEDETTNSSNLSESDAQSGTGHTSRGVKRKSGSDSSLTHAYKHGKPDETNMDYSNSAEIEFLHSIEDDKIKQQVAITDNDQTVYSINTTKRMSRPIPDLDINLGDYLPENCTLRPEDINIKRITTGTGEQLIFSIKYSKSST